VLVGPVSETLGDVVPVSDRPDAVRPPKAEPDNVTVTSVFDWETCWLAVIVAGGVMVREIVGVPLPTAAATVRCITTIAIAIGSVAVVKRIVSLE
jgi:hypothetical protein